MSSPVPTTPNRQVRTRTVQTPKAPTRPRKGTEFARQRNIRVPSIDIGSSSEDKCLEPRSNK